MCTQISSMLMHWETLSHTSRSLIISNATAWGECLGGWGVGRLGGGGMRSARVHDCDLISSCRWKADACSPAAESSHLVPVCISYTNVITGGNSLFSARTEHSLSNILESDFQPEQNSKEHLADPSTLKPKCSEIWIICNVIRDSRFLFWIKTLLQAHPEAFHRWHVFWVFWLCFKRSHTILLLFCPVFHK